MESPQANSADVLFETNQCCFFLPPDHIQPQTLSSEWGSPCDMVFPELLRSAGDHIAKKITSGSDLFGTVNHYDEKGRSNDKQTASQQKLCSIFLQFRCIIYNLFTILRKKCRIFLPQGLDIRFQLFIIKLTS